MITMIAQIILSMRYLIFLDNHKRTGQRSRNKMTNINNYVIVADDRQDAVNKVTIEVPAGRTIEDAEMFWEERLKAEGVENIDYAIAPRGQVAENIFLLGWNEQ